MLTKKGYHHGSPNYRPPKLPPSKKQWLRPTSIRPYEGISRLGYPPKKGYQHNKELPTTAGCSIFASANIWRKNIWTNAPAFDESEVGAIWPRLVSATRHEHTANDVTLNPYVWLPKVGSTISFVWKWKITERNFHVRIIPPKSESS